MKKLFLSALPVAALSVIAFAASPETGVQKLTDDPLYQVSRANTISETDKEKITNLIAQAYNLQDVPESMEFDMLAQARGTIIFRRKTVKSIDVEEMVAVDQGGGTTTTTKIAAILARYE